MGREEDDRKCAGRFLAFEIPTNGPTIRARESDIQEEQVGERTLHLLHSRSIALNFHVVPCLFEHQLQHVPDPWIVFGDEYSFRHAALFLLFEPGWVRTEVRTER